MKLTRKSPLGKSGLEVPPMIFGTSYLGNLYRAMSYREKLELIRGWFQSVEKPVVIDTAGKYGAGLALEVIGRGLDELGIDPSDILISNKLGWYRVPLSGREPTFEPGAWVDLEHDSEQRFGYNGIIQCYEQGMELLGRKYSVDIVSLHDPDEYLNGAGSPADRESRLVEIIESYRALSDLKREGKVSTVGIGAKDWIIIRELYEYVPFDWVMFANSYTVMKHPAEMTEFMDRLQQDGVGIINSALFHGGFLTGGSKFDYREVDPDSGNGKFLSDWREAFYSTCRVHLVDPVDACIHFGLSHPAISAIALNTSHPGKMVRNVEILQKEIPPEFWLALKKQGLIALLPIKFNI
jgi:D-threo-aldose 1-dehydrogenase